MTTDTPTAQKKDDWLERKVAYIKGLKSPSEAHQLLILLAAKATRTAEENRKLLAIVKAEKLAERTARARADLQRTLNPPTENQVKERKKAERNARTNRLVTLGAIFDQAGIGNGERTHAELLGLVKSSANFANRPENAEKWLNYASVGKAHLDAIDRRKAEKRDAAKTKSSP